MILFERSMPLNSLRESIQTLSALLHQSRTLRLQQDPPAGALERLDVMTDETLETMRQLVDLLLEAHRRGDLDSMVKHDRESPEQK